MSVVRLGFNDLVEGADITASDEVATLPFENLKGSQLGCKGRSTTTDITLDFDLGAAYAVTGLFISAHNISSSVTVLKWQNKALVGDSYADYVNLLDPVGNASYNAYDSKQIIWYPAPGSKRYWRLVITDASNIDGYIEIGAVRIFSYYEPSKGAARGISISRKDLSEIQNGLNGSKYANVKSKQWIFGIALNNIPSDPAGTDDLQSLMDMFDIIGSTKDIVVSIDPYADGSYPYKNLKKLTLYGSLSKDFGAKDVTVDMYNMSYTFEEAL